MVVCVSKMAEKSLEKSLENSHSRGGSSVWLILEGGLSAF